MGIRETIHDKLYTTFYLWIFIYGYGKRMETRIFIYGYGRTMETKPVERLERMEITLKTPPTRTTATTTHQSRSSGYHTGHNHY